MRRFLAALLALILIIGGQAHAQSLLLRDPLPVVAAGGCIAATNFLARTSSLSGTETTAYTNMICGLVTDGVITGNLSGVAGCGTGLGVDSHGTVHIEVWHGQTSTALRAVKRLVASPTAA